MAFGLGRLGVAPAIFWAMTPRELAAAMRAHAPQARDAAPTRAELRALDLAYPDGAGDER